MSTKSKQAAVKDKNCIRFEPQAWRKHVCKNCFRTKEQHEVLERQRAAEALAANGSIRGKDPTTAIKDATASASKTAAVGSPKVKRSEVKGSSVGSKSAGNVDSNSKSKFAGDKSDAAIATKKSGPLRRTGSKDNGDGSPSQGKSQKVSGISKKQTAADRPSSGKRVSPPSPLSPPAGKKSPLSPPTGKKSPLSPPMGKKSPLSPPTGKKSPLSPPTSKKAVAIRSKMSGASVGPPSKRNISGEAANLPVEEAAPRKDDPARGRVDSLGTGGTTTPGATADGACGGAAGGATDGTPSKITPRSEAGVSVDKDAGLAVGVGDSSPLEIPDIGSNLHAPEETGATDAVPPAEDSYTTSAATIVLEPAPSGDSPTTAHASSGSGVAEPSAQPLTPNPTSPSPPASPTQLSSPSEKQGSGPVSFLGDREGLAVITTTGRGVESGTTTEGSEQGQGEEGRPHQQQQQQQVDTQGRAPTLTDTTTTATISIPSLDDAPCSVSESFDLTADSDNTQNSELPTLPTETHQIEQSEGTGISDGQLDIVIIEDTIDELDQHPGSDTVSTEGKQTDSGLITVPLSAGATTPVSVSPADQWFETETELPPPAAFSDPKTPELGLPVSDVETTAEVTLSLDGGVSLTERPSEQGEQEEVVQGAHTEKHNPGPTADAAGVSQGVLAHTEEGASLNTSQPAGVLSVIPVQYSRATLKLKPTEQEEDQEQSSDDYSSDGSHVAGVSAAASEPATLAEQSISASPGVLAAGGGRAFEPLTPTSSDVTKRRSAKRPRERQPEHSVRTAVAADAAPAADAEPTQSTTSAAATSAVATAAAATVSQTADSEPPSSSSPELVDDGPLIESAPVFASTFQGVSKPSSPDNVAATSISLDPSDAATFQSPPPPQKEPGLPPPTGSFVNKVDSFVVRQRGSPSPTELSSQVDRGASLNFEHYTIEPSATFTNSSKRDTSDDLIEEGYGGYQSKGQGQGQGGAVKNLHEEDITTIASVTIGNARKDLLPVQRSNSLDSGDRDSVFHIARHRPQENFQNFERTVQFSGTGRRRRRMSDAFVREDAMMEGTRMLIDNLREKHMLLEEKNNRLEREKSALADLLAVKKHEFIKIDDEFRRRLTDLEGTCSCLDSENKRLTERLKLPESERIHIRDQEKELEELKKKLNEAEDVIGQLTDESASLQNEIRGMHLEMEEMHDQFRDDEAMEFRDLQKELEATAKNCRILQFKLRKAERRNDALESDRLQYEEKVRHLESRFKNSNDQNQIRELEEELRMAKEVSVRLHDELEIVEERRIKFEEELDRTHDLLRESERGRSVLQKELDSRTEELEQLRERESEDKDVISDKLDVPVTKKPALGKTGSRESSVEYDIEQLMRDLSDSLEREHDLKGQLKYAEEETINLRNKLSESEDENEIINLQLQKMSSAKSGKYFQKRGIEERDIVTEKEHELRIQMELAEEEINVLRRKMNEIERENETLSNEVRNLNRRLNADDKKSGQQEQKEEDDTRPHEERIAAMARGIDLKWQQIEEEDEVGSLRRQEGSRRGRLRKSQSLDSDQTIDLKRQLEVVTQEANVLKEKVLSLQCENEAIQTANNQLELSGGSRKGPSNTAAEDRIQTLEAENTSLKEKITSLEAKTNALSEEVKKDVDLATCTKRVAELEASNTRLLNDLKRYESTDEGKKSKAEKEELNLETASEHQLRERIKDLEGEVQGLKEVVMSREDETKRLESEVKEYRDDLDKMLDTFKERESCLQAEITMWEHKNATLSNLLAFVTERTESIRSEKPSQSTASMVSALSDVTPGSDEVFALKEEALQSWDDKFLCRIRSLENLLTDERQRAQAAEKRLLMKDGQQSALTDDMKLHQREKEILLQEKTIKEVLEGEKELLQQELTLCQKQLSESQEHGRSLRTRLDKMQKVHDTMRQDVQKMSAQLEEAKMSSGILKKKLEEKEKELQKAAAKEDDKKSSGKDARSGGGVRDKEPASWRWEKQEMDRTIKELRKKTDDLHRQLSRQQVRVKLAGDDRPRGDSAKTKQLENDIQTLKDEAGAYKKQIVQLEARIKEEETGLKAKEKQWDDERELLESDRKAALHETSQKDQIITSKDGIIKQKEGLLQQKGKALKDREDSMLGHDTILKQKEDALNAVQKQLDLLKSEGVKLRAELKQKEGLHIEIEGKLKVLNENLRARDERIREKDDIIENLNRSLSEKDSAVNDMDNSIRQAMKKLDEKDLEMKTLLAKTDDMKDMLNTLKGKSEDHERKLHNTEREHGKEIASLVILREKMEAHISQLKREKKTSDEEVQEHKRVLMEKEDFWRSCRNDLESELRTVKEKLHSLEGARMGKEGETILKLSGERDDLVNEKNILVKEVKRLARELENAEMEWQKEKKTFRNLLGEKDEALREKVATCSRLSEQDLDASQLHKWLSSEARKLTAESTSEGDVTKTTTEAALPPDVISAMDRSDLIHKAEKVSLEELYENRLRIVRDQLAQAHGEVHTMQRENAELREVLVTSQRTLADLKRRHDADCTTWQEEKGSMERKTQQNAESRKKLDALQRVVDELESQVHRQERQRTDMEVRLKTDRAKWDAEKVTLQGQINRLEEQLAMTASGKIKWSERQKRDSAWDEERSDNRKALTEYQTLVRDLEAKLTSAERSGDKRYIDLTNQLESSQKAWERERGDLTTRCNQMEESSKQVDGLHQTLIDLQYKLQSVRESAVREKADLLRRLAEAETGKLDEKQKFAELLAEVKKVKELTPLMAKKEGVELEIKRSASPGEQSGRTSRILQVTPTGQLSTTTGTEVVRTIPIRRIVDEPYDKPLVEDSRLPREGRAVNRSTGFSPEGASSMLGNIGERGTSREQEGPEGQEPALQRILQLAEDLSKIDIKRPNRPAAPAAFRRSLSTSEVEDYRDFAELEQLQSTLSPPQQVQDDPQVTRRKPPTSSGPSSDDTTDDVRYRPMFRRAQSAQVPDIQVTPVGRQSRSGSARNSMYASGTQSAYSSRDASPDKRFGVRKLTPYPAAPPSFLITPSRTPRRVTVSVDREIISPVNHMQNLYDKLSVIEREQSEAEQQKQLQRKRGMRMLVKSMSVDSCRDDDPEFTTNPQADDPGAHFCPKQLDSIFEDAPKSQTLPASIRLGELVLTPGSEQLTKSYGPQQMLSGRLQSSSARKKFYENYPLYTSGFFSWPGRKTKKDRAAERKAKEAGSLGPQPLKETPIPQETVHEKPTETKPKVVVKIGKGKEKKEEDEPKKESKFSYFFSSVKDRRKLFSKKSKSVDESPVRSSVVRVGLQAGHAAAAPSTFEPEVKEATPRPSSLRMKLHKRAASLDITSLFSTSSSGGSGAPSTSWASHEGPGTSSGGGVHRHSALGTPGDRSLPGAGGAAVPSTKDQASRDGTCAGRAGAAEEPPTPPPLTPKFPRPKSPLNRRLPSRWRTPSMEKAAQRPIVFHDDEANRFKIIVKRRSLSESNVVFMEHMEASKVWSFAETPV